MLWLAGIMSAGEPVNFLESFFFFFLHTAWLIFSVDGVTLASVWSAF